MQRTMVKLAALTAALTLAVPVLAAPVEARSKRAGSYYDNCPNCRAYGYQTRRGNGYKYRNRGQSMDQIIAESLDPGGDLAAYPAWARKALAPKSGNGGGGFR